jgi:hypothetical protein
MKVRVVKPFVAQGETIKAGTLLDIPEHLLPQMAGLVEQVDVHRLIADTISDIDRAGRPWPLDFYASLPTAVLERLTELMQAVEAAALAEDVAATAERLAAYRAELFRHLN